MVYDFLNVLYRVMLGFGVLILLDNDGISSIQVIVVESNKNALIGFFMIIFQIIIERFNINSLLLYP